MLSEEEKKAIDKLKGRKKIGIYELIRTFKREGIENFVTTRKQYIETILNLIEKQQAEIEKKDKIIDEIKSKLEEHIKFCEQEAKGSLNNEICHIALNFDKSLLNILQIK